MTLRELRLDSTPVSSWLNRASSVQNRAASLLDEEFRHLLDRSREKNKNKNHNNNGDVSSDSSTHESDRCVLQEEETFPDFPPESISTLKKITGAMISAGYEAECCMSYEMSRRHAFKEELSEVGFEGINVEDVQRIPWESLEGEIANWISIVRRCSAVLFPGELSLCTAVFPDATATRKRLFTGLVSAVTIRFLDFSGAVVLTKRSSEKLFKFLDMYETLRDLIPAVEQSDSDLIEEIKLAQTRLGEAAVTIFGELENSIKTDQGRTAVPSGAVHPLTRYTMNYLKYACEYKDTLDQVFQTEPEPETKQSICSGPINLLKPISNKLIYQQIDSRKSTSGEEDVEEDKENDKEDVTDTSDKDDQTSKKVEVESGKSSLGEEDLNCSVKEDGEEENLPDTSDGGCDEEEEEEKSEQESRNVEKVDLEKMTLGDWFKYMEVYLRKKIVDETEEMIEGMRAKSRRVHQYIAEQKGKEKDV